MAKIEKDTLIADALEAGDSDKIAETLRNFGMHCFGCSLARGETIEQAAEAHGVDVETMLKELNAHC